MTREELRHTLKNKLKECDKDTLVDIIAGVCLMYIRAIIFTDMSSANCMQQPLNNIQTNIQEINNFITQKVQEDLYGKRIIK